MGENEWDPKLLAKRWKDAGILDGVIDALVDMGEVERTGSEKGKRPRTVTIEFWAKDGTKLKELVVLI